MGSTLIDLAGDYGTRYAVYQAERDGEGKIKLVKTIFKPHAAQIEFFSATERHVLLHGNRGCGKSASLLWKAIQTAYLVPGSRVAIFRKTWPELQRSVWDELMKLPQDLFESINSSNHTVTIKAKAREGQWKRSKIWFVTAENIADARKVLGFEVHTLLIDEWAEIELDIWRFMSGSVRSPLAVDIAGQPTSAQILGASTPGGAGAEALKCLFGCDGPKKQAPGEDKSTYRPDQYRAIKASIDQNPTYAVGTPAGDQYRASLRDLPLAMQAKWVRGDWGAVEGCYFSIWDASRMVIPFAQIPAH
jgi:phage terminase large subunit